MKLMLVCNAGMSTSMLVSKIENAAKEQGIELEVAAFPLTQAEKVIDDWDVVMLGPQVRHCLPQLKKATDKTPIEVIDMKDYGLMNGANVLKKALEIVNNK